MKFDEKFDYFFDIVKSQITFQNVKRKYLNECNSSYKLLNNTKV